MTTLERKLYEHIAFLYGEARADEIFRRLMARLDRFRAAHPDLAESSPEERVSERDAILITYGDMVQQPGERPLQTLADFLRRHLADVISTVHILPFYPYSSDDGFAVIDYRQVNPDLGTWEDIAALGRDFRLMFDAVINHVSSQSVWFQGFLRGDPKFRDFFTVVDPDTDLARVFRPRATPVLTPFETAEGVKYVWTTFSADQIDLNFANPEVLLEVLDILLFYAAHGAEFIRLDAVTFVWKEIGTSCINSPQTHRIVQTIRTVFDIAAPRVAIITETNVPHRENIAYFGDGSNEAQMVYNFALPLLTLHAFHSGDVRTLSGWAKTLELPSDRATFFNFLAGHDGIGMLPVKEILSPQELDALAARTRALGGFVSYKSNEDGSQSPYELNINYLDALDDPDHPLGDPRQVARRFLASQAIMLALRGVPGIYFHSLFGSRNWREGVRQTGRYRTINREKLQREPLERELADPESLRYHVFRGYHHMLRVRRENPAFHPWGGQRILDAGKSVFALLRSARGGVQHVLCLQNVSGETVDLRLPLEDTPLAATAGFSDILGSGTYAAREGILTLKMHPYQVLWLSPSDDSQR